MLDELPRVSDPRLVVGTAGFDDAGVIRLSDELALAQSVDFFTPIVDDPFDFGRIAAANALSDLYAMGATPLSALAVCAFPAGSLPLSVLRETLAGGLATLATDGVVPLGGHTIKGPEFNYGLAVTGVVHPDRVLTNAGARPGDALVLTKKIGTGVLATELKAGRLPRDREHCLVASMAETNRAASEACREVGVHALTDISGYGLLGHALELADASGVSLEIMAAAVPLLPGAREAVANGAIPGGLIANQEWITPRVDAGGLDPVMLSLLCDPQTSGGLLAALAPDTTDTVIAACRARGVDAAVIGRVRWRTGPVAAVIVPTRGDLEDSS